MDDDTLTSDDVLEGTEIAEEEESEPAMDGDEFDLMAEDESL